MQRLRWQDLASPGATLAAGVSSGFVAGLLFGGVGGGRFAMLLLRLTSDPVLRGMRTDDGFTIGVFSTETLFLLGVTAGLGIEGGLFYLIVRGWIPDRSRVIVMTLYVGLVGGAGLISPDGIDFSVHVALPQHPTSTARSVRSSSQSIRSSPRVRVSRFPVATDRVGSLEVGQHEEVESSERGAGPGASTRRRS